MKKTVMAAAIMVTAVSCKMENPLLTESPYPYGAPQFDKIENKHYMPAFEQGVKEGKAEIDAIVANPEAPSFENTILALENSGKTLNRVEGIFFNLMEADTNDEMQEIAEKANPLLTGFSMYVTLNDKLFERVKAVWDSRGTLDLDQEESKLLEKTYKSFARNGANLSPEDKKTYSALVEELSNLQLAYGKNSLAATNAYCLNITDSTQLGGLPDYIKAMGADAAREKGKDGWVFDLSYPSYGPFMKYSTERELRRQMYFAYNSKAIGGEFDNTENVKKIIAARIKIANILGYEKYSDYALEERMAKNTETVRNFLTSLMEPSLPYARADVAAICEYARANGFEDTELQPWDFSFWSEKYKAAEYALDEQQLKPYFQLENCIPAVFDLAHRLYGLNFEERSDIPVYHPDVKVYDVTDSEGRHKALFYADFFPRASKRSGAWMTEFRGQSIVGGVEERPFISIVTNFTKPTAEDPSLLTHDELTTFLHEFGHSIHGILAEGRFESLTGTNVARDFVELPSQIMENWAFEKEYLETFAKNYRTGEVIPSELIDKIVKAQNYLSGYLQVRQLHFGVLDMAWHTLAEVPEDLDVLAFEKSVLEPYAVMPSVDGCAISPAFGHIFTGGYSAGYYSYKWAEVLEADAFALFKERGVFSKEAADAFKDNILSKGASQDADVLYRNFRGRDPEPEALLKKLGLVSK